MSVGLACALGTSLCYGAGSVLQAAAATDAPPATGLDPRLLVTLTRSWRYPAGLALDGLGFLLSLVALRTVPLYVVQSVVSSFLAVTAVIGVLFLGLRMRRRELLALTVVVLGLTLVGLSSTPQPAGTTGARTQLLVLAGAVLSVLATLAAGRAGDRAWLLGGAAGLAFGVVAVAARALPHDLHHMLDSPALYAMVLVTPFALTAYATALQRGTVVQATAPLVVAETVLPALAGLALFSDHPRPGWGAVAVLGFVLAVGASLQLSRYGEVEVAGARDPVGS